MHQLKGQIQVARKYAIFILKDNTYQQIVAELPEVFTVEDCIKFSLMQFNKELGTKYQFAPDEFMLKVSKKSGEPKSDLPSLDYEQIISETGSLLFTIVQQQEKKIKDNITTTDTSLVESSIKSRPSYHNGLTKNKKPIEKKDKEGGGFCFFKQCI
ncbi:hypothetical protein pb186bvf_014204 [Paramecium bursaria]